MVSQQAGGLEVGFEGSLKIEFTGTRITFGLSHFKCDGSVYKNSKYVNEQYTFT